MQPEACEVSPADGCGCLWWKMIMIDRSGQNLQSSLESKMMK